MSARNVASRKPARRKARAIPRTRPALGNTRRGLNRLLAARNEHPENLGDIDRRIREAFAETHAVLVLDMCGFSRLTMRHGITHFLAMIHRLHGIVTPLIATQRGRVVKTVADNVFAVFPDVAPAIRAARQIQRHLTEANAILPADWDLHTSIGIGYGELLMVGRNDLYGSEMNLASKLGEDIAGSGEICLTEAAHARVVAATPAVRFEKLDISVAQMTLLAFKLRGA